MLRKLLLTIFFGFSILQPNDAQAHPLQQSGTTYVRVCYENSGINSCPMANNNNSELVALDTYTAQVLANEWHRDAGLEALKAGAVAIRTFVYRELGCGAFIRNNTELPPITTSRLVSNFSQIYRFGGRTGSQNTVTTNHTTARNDTNNIYLYRTDNTYACARHYTNTGNPNKACIAPDCNATIDQTTLQETIDPVATNLNIAARTGIGMSQNGTVAWNLGSGAWTYRQMLAHYYHLVKIGASDTTNYRWNWLNVGNTIAFSGYPGGNYEQYFNPIDRAPAVMGVGQVYWVPIRIENTGSSTWNQSGTNPVKLSYHWYTPGGALVTWEGRRTNLGQDVAPGGNIYINAQVLAPTQLGTYVLKWDMVKENVTWFSQQGNWPTHDIQIQVQQPTVYEIMWRNNNQGASQGWQRTYSVVNGVPGAASGWTSIPSASGDFPPGGTMLTQNSYVVHDTYIQGYWRGNTEAVAEGHTRSAQIANGALGTLSGWSMPALFLTTSGLPGSGLIQTQNNFVEGTQLRQGYWRNNIGYGRVVPIFDGRVLWSMAPTTWNTFTLSDTWPPDSSGAIEAQSGYVLGDVFYQELWRGGKRWSRSVQIVDGVLTSTVLSNWQDTTATANLPSGSGSVQAHTHYVLP